ncbi:MAG: hypothetical protein WDM96_12435 [Lacunisphaera sp.]
MSRRLFRIAGWSCLGLALLVTGYLLMNTTFMMYDDEGFVLISLRNYLAGLRLYNDVFSQYGPWPYVYHQIIITLGGHVPLTHTLGRAITLGHWTAMALLCGGVAWRLTRSQLAAGAASILSFTLTWQMVAEPSHPGSHIALLVALAGLLAALLPDTRRPVAVYAGLGIIIALLMLTKINVGLLLAAGVGGFILQHTAWPTRGRGVAWLGAAGLLALPWVLLGKQLPQGWVLIFAVQFTLSAAGLLWLDRRSAATDRLAPRAWRVVPLAVLVTLGVVCGWVLARGTTLDALVQTVLLSPLRMPARFTVSVLWMPETWVLAATGGLLVARAGWEIRRRGELSGATTWLVAGMRLVVFLFFLRYLADWAGYLGVYHFMADCLPLLPVFLVPLGAPWSERARLARWGVAWIALPQVLHAFPVAGSQLGWATFLGVPLLVAGWWEAGGVLRDRAGAAGRQLARASGLVLAVACLFLLGLVGYTGWERYVHSRPLDLPGAEDIRLDGSLRQSMRLITLNASIHADLLFSRQGMYSYNLWSGVPTPTAQNATHWFWLLDERQQREIITRLAATPRSAVITSTYLDDLLARFHVPVSGPLQDFVQQQYRPLFTYGGFVFNVPLASRAAVFGRYEALSLEAGERAAFPLVFRGNVRLHGRVAAIQLERINYPWDTGFDLLTRQTRAFVQPIDPAGRPAGESLPLPTSQPLDGLYRLSVFSPRLPPALSWQENALVVRDPAGRVLSESFY